MPLTESLTGSLTPTKLRLLTFSLLTVSFLGALDHTVVSTSLATIAGDLGALEHLGWIVVGYTLSSTVMLPVIGKLGDRLGPRRVFLISLVLFLGASLACGFAPSIEWLVVARVLQGMSSAGLQLMSQTIVARVTSPRQRPGMLSIIGAAFPVAILVGPLLGGLITDFWGWHWIFWINLPIGVAAFALAVVAIPHIEPAPRARFDVAGAATLSVGLIALVFAVTWMTDAEQALSSIVAFVIAGVALVVFTVIELKTAEPIIPVRFFANRTVAAGTALSAIIGVGLFSVTAYMPTYVQMAYQATATVSGLVPIATVLGMLVSSLFTGWYASRTGRYRIFPIAGSALSATGFLAMSVLPVGLPLWVPMIIMALVGVGTGSFMSLIVAVVQSAVSSTQTGSITATVNLARQVGSTVATAVIGGAVGVGVAMGLPAALDASTLTPAFVHSATAAVQAEVAGIYQAVFAPIFVALAVAYLAGIVASLLLPAGRLSDERMPEPQSVDA